MTRAQRLLSATLCAALAAMADAPPPAPPAECEARVGYDRDRVMSGYILPTAAGPRTCIPFSTVAAYPPAGYKGDFYVDEFSDARMREQWAACKQEKACFERVSRAINARQPPNREYDTKNPRHIYLLGKIVEGPEIDLKSIRRPAFFAADPWKEPIAGVDPRTWIVEFTAPREPYERIHKKMTDPIRLRGWYIRGDGVDDARQGKRRALVIMSGGGGTRTTAITDPRDRLYRIDASGKTHFIPVPSETSGATGQNHWRAKAALFNKAGFDVMLFDRRGVGISGGYSDTNTHQQGRDLLAIVASLRTGVGMRALSPAGETLEGRPAAERVRGGRDDGMPVILFGNSRGTMATGWAMTKNFDRDCTLDLPTITCGPPLGDRTIKGAILFAEFTSGQGYVMDKPSIEDEQRGLGRDRPLFIGGNEVENNLIFFPSSAILAGMHKWPAAFFARGLFDYAASLQGTVDSYSRVKGPKELVVVRGPHPFESWPAQERRRSQERAVAFAIALIQGKTRIDDARPWKDMKELVATADDVWEESTRPTLVPLPAQSFHRLESTAQLQAEAPDWDYLSLDPARNRLFIAARPDGLIVYDTEAKRVVATLEDTRGANASLPLPELDRLYVVNQDGTATVFQLSTLKKLDKVEMGKEADAAFYDPVTKEIAVMRGDSAEVTFLEAASGRIVARLKMPTRKLEASAADGHGNMFIAIRDRNSVIKLDMRSHAMVAEYPANCEEANGMAIDRANGRLFVGCRGKNPVLSVMDAASGKVVATLPIGRGNDGVVYDPDTRRVYASGGVDGNLVVYSQVDPDTYKLVEATTTRPYARTMAFHPVTKKLYLVTAEGTVDPSLKRNTGPAPFYPNRYHPGTFTLLTYSPR